MSYCRKGHNSDLYIIGTGDGFECLVCPLQEGEYSSWYGETHYDLYHHMLDHVSRDHRVPLDAIKRAKAEMDGREWVSQEIEFDRLLWRLAAPKMIFDFFALTGHTIDLLDHLEDEFPDLEFNPENLVNHPVWDHWPEDDED